jgi:hypothetical protein
MSSPNPSQDPFDSDEQWDPFDDPSQQQTQADKLSFCHLSEWDSKRTYDEDPPIYIQYSIEWKVTVKGRAIMRTNTEQNVVLAPADCWECILQRKLENVLCKKNKPLTSEDTTVVVSVSPRPRTERDLQLQYDDTSVE